MIKSCIFGEGRSGRVLRIIHSAGVSSAAKTIGKMKRKTGQEKQTQNIKLGVVIEFHFSKLLYNSWYIHTDLGWTRWWPFLRPCAIGWRKESCICWFTENPQFGYFAWRYSRPEYFDTRAETKLYLHYSWRNLKGK